MKSLLLPFLALVASLMLTSCNLSKSKLAAEVEKTNAKCPIDMGMLGNVSSLTYENDEVVLTYAIKEGFPLDLSAFESMKDCVKQNVMGTFAKNPTCKTLMQEMKKAEAGMTLAFKTSDGKEFKLKLSPEDITQVADGNIEPLSAKASLVYNIKMTNAQCPMQVDEVTVLDKLIDEGEYVVYCYTVDENKVSMEAVRENIGSLKSALSQKLHNTDPLLSDLLALCRQNARGLIYRYVGSNSGNSVDITFETNEL